MSEHYYGNAAEGRHPGPWSECQLEPCFADNAWARELQGKMSDIRIPSPGRIIHVLYDKEHDGDSTFKCRPAIVSGLDHSDETIFVTIFSPNLAPQQGVLHYDDPGWHWPPRGRVTERARPSRHP